jgi:hypothetical protein
MSALAEVREAHTRILRCTLAAEESQVFWERVDPEEPAHDRNLRAFEERWFGAKSQARVRDLLSSLAAPDPPAGAQQGERARDAALRALRARALLREEAGDARRAGGDGARASRRDREAARRGRPHARRSRGVPRRAARTPQRGDRGDARARGDRSRGRERDHRARRDAERRRRGRSARSSRGSSTTSCPR